MKIIIIVFLLCASSILSIKIKNEDTLSDKCKKSCVGWLSKPAEDAKDYTIAMWSKLPANNRMEDPNLVVGRLYDSKSGELCVCTDATKDKKRALLFLTIKDNKVTDKIEVCKPKDQAIFKNKWLNKPEPVEKPVTKKGGKKGPK